MACAVGCGSRSQVSPDCMNAYSMHSQELRSPGGFVREGLSIKGRLISQGILDDWLSLHRAEKETLVGELGKMSFTA